MIHRIEVGLKPQVKDVQGDMIAQKSKKLIAK